MCIISSSTSRLQYLQCPQRDPFIRLFHLPESHPGLAIVVVFKLPASLLILLRADEFERVGESFVFAISQPHQRFGDLQNIGNVKDWEPKLPPIAAWVFPPSRLDTPQWTDPR